MRAGLDQAALTEAAANQGFLPVPMDLKAAVSFTNTINHSMSKNVIGVVPGSEKADEAFLYMAHWDHFGTDPDMEGDGIFFLKQLKHARGIRNNIVDSFEKAAVPTVTANERKRLLSFVVVGGGPTSCEFVSELHGTLGCCFERSLASCLLFTSW